LVRLSAGLPFTGFGLPGGFLGFDVRLFRGILDRRVVLSVTHYCGSSPVRGLKNPNRAVGTELGEGQGLMDSGSKHVRVVSSGSTNNDRHIPTAGTRPGSQIHGVPRLRLLHFRQVSLVPDGCHSAVTIAVRAVPLAPSVPARQIPGSTCSDGHEESARLR